MLVVATQGSGQCDVVDTLSPSLLFWGPAGLKAACYGEAIHRSLLEQPLSVFVTSHS